MEKEYNAWLEFCDDLQSSVKTFIQSNGKYFVESVKEQLYSGLDGDDRELTPNYLNDPFFNSKDAGRWKNNNKGYMIWKSKITPPQSSYLGFRARNIETPNLIIVGDFYNSIFVKDTDNGIEIGSDSTLGASIEKKYGSRIFKVSDLSFYWKKQELDSDIQSLINKYKA